MNTIRELHEEAMDLAERADRAKKQGNEEEAQELYRRALELETQAAEETPFDSEPTRSILYRSAATLALDCHLEETAKHLASKGLEGTPPDDIEDELRNILSDVASRQRSANIVFPGIISREEKPKKSKRKISIVYEYQERSKSVEPIRHLIAQGNLEIAIASFRQLVPTNHEVTLLRAREDKVRRAFQVGLISHQEYSAEMDQLAQALTDELDKYVEN